MTGPVSERVCAFLHGISFFWNFQIIFIISRNLYGCHFLVLCRFLMAVDMTTHPSAITVPTHYGLPTQRERERELSFSLAIYLHTSIPLSYPHPHPQGFAFLAWNVLLYVWQAKQVWSHGSPKYSSTDGIGMFYILGQPRLENLTVTYLHGFSTKKNIACIFVYV